MAITDASPQSDASRKHREPASLRANDEDEAQRSAAPDLDSKTGGPNAESVKPGETRRVYALCVTSSMGWLIHAIVGSLGGCGRRVNRVGFAA